MNISPGVALYQHSKSQMFLSDISFWKSCMKTNVDVISAPMRFVNRAGLASFIWLLFTQCTAHSLRPELPACKLHCCLKSNPYWQVQGNRLKKLVIAVKLVHTNIQNIVAMHLYVAMH